MRNEELGMRNEEPKIGSIAKQRKQKCYLLPATCYLRTQGVFG